jgi:hypothetical protein
VPGTFPVVGLDVQAELPAGAKVAVHPAVPAGQAAGAGERRPQVAGIDVVTVFDAHDAPAFCRPQAAQDAGLRTCVLVISCSFVRVPQGHPDVQNTQSLLAADAVAWVGRPGDP